MRTLKTVVLAGVAAACFSVGASAQDAKMSSALSQEVSTSGFATATISTPAQTRSDLGSGALLPSAQAGSQTNAGSVATSFAPQAPGSVPSGSITELGRGMAAGASSDSTFSQNTPAGSFSLTGGSSASAPQAQPVRLGVDTRNGSFALDGRPQGATLSR